MSLLLIDDQGEIWDGQSRKLREAFDSPYSGGEFADYAIANLGFIALNVYGNSCQVRLRPSTIGERSLAALRSWFGQTRCERLVLTWLDRDWSNELMRGCDLAFARVTELIEAGARAKPDDFLARLIPDSELHPQSPLGELVRQWPRISMPTGQHALMHILENTIGNRYVIVKHDSSMQRVVFHEFGDGLYGKYETWRMCAVGAPIEEQPDRDYGKWVADAYAEALAAPKPMIADIDAIVRWPHSGRTRMRYKRVLVPIVSAAGAPMLLGGSLLDNRIDLRVGLG